MADEARQLEVLFLGLGSSRVAWYRIVLPAMALGCDWMGVVGTPPALQFVTGYVKGATQVARLDDYDVVVAQQPRGPKWAEVIRNLRKAGKVVLYEVDDYVHGIRKAKDHDFAAYFQPKDLRAMELCMRACNGLICSTDYIARRYSRYAEQTWVCHNGLDLGRYRMTRPPRGKIDGKESVTIMWSGATGHRRGVNPWIQVVDRIMEKYPHVCFATIGQDFAGQLGQKYRDRVIAIPFAALETYPAAMMLGDIALAPAGDSSWYRGKSDLRAMEAAALGIPVVADEHYSESVVDGITGFLVESPADAYDHLADLVEDVRFRGLMGQQAKVHANLHFGMEIRREQWRNTIIEAWEAAQAARSTNV